MEDGARRDRASNDGAPLSEMVRRLQASAARRAEMGYTANFDVFFEWFRDGELQALCGLDVHTMKQVWCKYCGRSTPICKVGRVKQGDAACRAIQHVHVPGVFGTCNTFPYSILSRTHSHTLALHRAIL
jgi:hypothetical protein